MKDYEKIKSIHDRKKTDVKPLLNSGTELEFEFIDSKWPDLNENFPHIIQDTKTGNLNERNGELEEVRHNLTSATMCLTFHKKYWLPKSYAGFVSPAAIILNTSLSKDALLLKEFHTIREKQHQKTEEKKKRFDGLPGFGKQQEEAF
jgi:hypothetical protein